MNGGGLVAGAPRHSPPVSPIDYRAPSGKLAVVREMLETLDTVTAAGQQHLMRRVLALLESHVAEVFDEVESGRGRVVIDLIQRLGREAGDHWPRTKTFLEHAHQLLGLLNAPVA